MNCQHLGKVRDSTVDSCFSRRKRQQHSNVHCLSKLSRICIAFLLLLHPQQHLPLHQRVQLQKLSQVLIILSDEDFLEPMGPQSLQPTPYLSTPPPPHSSQLYVYVAAVVFNYITQHVNTPPTAFYWGLHVHLASFFLS